MIESQRHSYHLVDPSPWPISASLGALATTVGGVMYMHSFQGGATLLSLGLIFLLYTMFVWWRDVLRESTLEGHHTKAVQLGLRYGFILFIVSEVMFFFAFFWAFFHSSLAPTVEIGGIWPPKGIGVLDPWEIPFLTILILLSSGAAVTWAYHAILAGKEKRADPVLRAAALLGFLVFLGLSWGLKTEGGFIWPLPQGGCPFCEETPPISGGASGTNPAFMPIVVEAVNFKDYGTWVSNQLCQQKNVPPIFIETPMERNIIPISSSSSSTGTFNALSPVEGIPLLDNELTQEVNKPAMQGASTSTTQTGAPPQDPAPDDTSYAFKQSTDLLCDIMKTLPFQEKTKMVPDYYGLASTERNNSIKRMVLAFLRQQEPSHLEEKVGELQALKKNSTLFQEFRSYRLQRND